LAKGIRFLGEAEVCVFVTEPRLILTLTHRRPADNEEHFRKVKTAGTGPLHRVMLSLRIRGAISPLPHSLAYRRRTLLLCFTWCNTDGSFWLTAAFSDLWRAFFSLL